MLVQVVLLRERGRRRSAEEVQAARLYEGHITVCTDPARRLPLGQWQRVAMLMPHALAVEPLLELFRMQVHSWNDRGLVLTGVEEVWTSRRQSVEYRQAWWVLFAPAVGGAPAPHYDELVERIVDGVAGRLGG